MKLIVGLGNPGGEYHLTRHNLGFRVVDELARRHQVEMSRNRFSALSGVGRVRHEEIVLLKPHTYMNRSGAALIEALNWFRCALANTMIICDDFALPLGQLRMRRGGGSGGHRGLQSIAEIVQSEQWPRLRLGIGRPDAMRDREFVLAKFSQEELTAANKMVAAAAAAVEIWVEAGIEASMERANRRIVVEQDKEESR